MSGGHFSTSPWSLKYIEEELETIINNKREYPEFSDETFQKIEIAVKQLQKTYEMIHAIDYLMEGDYSDKSFLEQWKEKVGE